MAEVLLVSDFFLVCGGYVVLVSFYGERGELCECGMRVLLWWMVMEDYGKNDFSECWNGVVRMCCCGVLI